MRHTLRFVLLSLLTASASQYLHAQNAVINVTGAAPTNPKALLDINVAGLPSAAKRGMLIPRMTLAQRTAILPLVAADAGLWVYQTDDGTNADPTLNASLAHGFWYVSPTTLLWVRWSASGSGWYITGNNNTTAVTHYLGTPAGSNDDLHIRTTNAGAQPQVLIDAATGFVGVNPIAAPVEQLDVNGGLKIYSGSAGNNTGTIKYDILAAPDRGHFGNVDGTATGWQRLENAETRYSPENYSPPVQQCLGASGQVIQGAWNGLLTPNGNANTPFATNTGSQIRGDHVQYLYRAAELTAAGLCTGTITGISFYCLSNDVPGSPGADIQIEVRMVNTIKTDFAIDTWDPAALWNGTTNFTPLNTDSLVSYLGNVGWKQWNFIPGGFNWTGGNVIIDVCYIRAATNGNSPPVQLQTGYSYSPTKWVQVTSGTNLAHGRTYDDVPLTANATMGTTTNRPVTRFNGKITTTGNGPATPAAFLQYPGGIVVDNVNTYVWSDANYRGPGTVVARIGVYDGNLALSDHVFDKYYDGRVHADDQKYAQGYAYVGLPDLKDYLEKERHLPNMPSRSEWEARGGRSLGQLETGLWETVETQSLHISELEKDLSAIEELAFGKNSDPAGLEAVIAELNASRRLTDQQKMHLTDALRRRINGTPDTK